jgi:general secretion pathway protein E
MKRVAVAPEQTLFGQALHQVAAGRTSLAEALRVVGDAL